MNVPFWLWLATVGGVLVLIALDFVIAARKPHHVGTAEAAKWVIFYIACAVLFGAGVWYFAGHDFGIQYFTGYITEYSLSVDNLFVFMVIISAFAVPAIHQQKVLLIGIALALVLRGIFIAVGAALISQFVWVFFLFGAVLVWTAISMVRSKSDEEYHENAFTRQMRKVFPVTDDYVSSKMVLKRDGKRWITPLFLVIVAIGSADVMFAVDSIPAIFGITQEAYLVFAANAFALMGLRQLYFLLGGLVTKLVYLSYGLAIILGFIGLKLVLHALHEYHVTPEWLQINNWLSLGVIVTVLVVTTVASLMKARNDPDATGTELNLNALAPEERAAQEQADAEQSGQSGESSSRSDATARGEA